MAGTSQRGCCPECGAPWRRVVEKQAASPGQRPGYARDCGARNDGDRAGHFIDASAQTTGWASTCGHAAEPVPCTVLDPFAGAGTVGLVAQGLGREYVLIELKPEYADMARERIRDEAPLFAEAIS